VGGVGDVSTSHTADVAAILSWFHEDPRRLVPLDPNDIHDAGESEKKDDSERLVSVAALGGDYAAAFAAAKTHGAVAHRNWSRFIEQILSAFRDPRGPFEDRSTGRAADDEDDEDDKRRKNLEPTGDGQALGNLASSDPPEAIARGLSFSLTEPTPELKQHTSGCRSSAPRRKPMRARAAACCCGCASFSTRAAGP
jgi:hypothetical protein